MRNISILGSTGSIGTQTLEVVDQNPDFNVVGLSAGSNIKLLEEQIRKYKPKVACVMDDEKAKELAIKVADVDVCILSSMEGLIEVATIDEADIVVTSIVGMIGIRPTIAAIRAGKDIALANKETLVAAGEIVMSEAHTHGVNILPVDSEHSAIFQSLIGQDKTAIDKIILTASGGPFRGKTKDELAHVTLEQALKHPNWTMGRKITIDSATLVNKGLEVIEAKWLFGVDASDVLVVIHPQSVLHSGIMYKDGAVIGQLGTPDMKLPILLALTYPSRRELDSKKLDFYDLASLTFEKPDRDTFLGLNLAYASIEKGGNIPCAMNAANERAVALFLDHKIGFLDIYDIISSSMEEVEFIEKPSLDDIFDTEQSVYEYISRRF